MIHQMFFNCLEMMQPLALTAIIL